MLAGLGPLLVAVLGGGGLVALVDQWRYRRKPKLDIVGLAQEIATRALAQAHAELADAYADATAARNEAARAYEQARAAQEETRQARAEVSELRLELAASRIEVQRLSALLVSLGAHP
ncbi:hypothetical protein GCM10018962_77690 [Dactylosporangium matsuzakiense]|uniref:phosphohistidine phosphatase n=1 Tax=Dactylosporangium matsuzakiense TaxID=53360 RepID=UPI0031E7A5BE